MFPNYVLPGFGPGHHTDDLDIADRQLFIATNTAAVKQLESRLNYISVLCTVSYYHQSSAKLVKIKLKSTAQKASFLNDRK